MKKTLSIFCSIILIAVLASSCEDDVLVEMEEEQNEPCTGSYCKLDNASSNNTIAFVDFSNPLTF